MYENFLDHPYIADDSSPIPKKIYVRELHDSHPTNQPNSTGNSLGLQQDAAIKKIETVYVGLKFETVKTLSTKLLICSLWFKLC
jgi:hypothetical protein